MELPANWVSVQGDEASRFEAELRRELPASHRLYGHNVRAIARRQGRDDVLFLSAEDQRSIFWVHLTRAVETDPRWPWTEVYADLQEFNVRWLREESDDS